MAFFTIMFLYTLLLLFIVWMLFFVKMLITSKRTKSSFLHYLGIETPKKLLIFTCVYVVFFIAFMLYAFVIEDTSPELLYPYFLLLFLGLGFLVFLVRISYIILLFILAVWLFIFIKVFITSKRAKCSFLHHLAIKTRKKFLVLTLITSVITIAIIGVSYDKARTCIILPNGYTIGKSVMVDLSDQTYSRKNIDMYYLIYKTFRIFDLVGHADSPYNAVLRDPKGNKLPIHTVDWYPYRLELDFLEKKRTLWGNEYLMDSRLYEFFYSKKEGFVIKAKKFDDLKKMYGDNFVKNIRYPDPGLKNGVFTGISSFYLYLQEDPTYPTKNCSIDMFRIKKIH